MKLLLPLEPARIIFLYNCFDLLKWGGFTSEYTYFKNVGIQKEVMVSDFVKLINVLNNEVSTSF